VEGNLSHGLRDGDGSVGKRARLDLAVEFGLGCASEPVEFQLFGRGEVGSECGVGFRDAFLLLVDKRLAEGEKQPVAVGDEDVVKELAKFSVFRGGRMLMDRAEQAGIGPPFVADELADQGKHGRNVADNPTSQNRDTGHSKSAASNGYGSYQRIDALYAGT